MRRLKGRAALVHLLACALLLSGCAREAPVSARYPTLKPVETPLANEPSMGPGEGVSAAFAPATAPPSRQIYAGTPPASRPTGDRASTRDETIILNFEETDIRHAAKALLGDFLGLNFAVDPEVKGVVDLRSTSPLGAGEALSAFETVLRQNGAALVEDDGIYRILPLAKARGFASLSAEALGAPLKPGYSVRVVPLRFIAAEEMAEILKPFQSEDGSIKADASRNLLVLSGSSGELRLWLETIENFDIDWFAGKSVGLFPLQNASAGDVIKELEAIYGTAEKNGEALRLVPVERVNAVMAVASDAGLVRNVGGWVERLDQNGRSTRALRVYKMKNARASDVAPVLQEIFGLPRTAQPPSASIVAPGETPVETEAPASGASLVSMSSGDSLTSTATAGAQQLKILPDEQLNSLVILASDEEYAAVESALRKLDQAPLQVLVEATVAEVTITEELRYGVQYLLDGTLFSEPATAILTQAQTATIASVVPGFSTVIGSPAKIILDALESVTEVNVISSPNLMVLDNETATLSVGNQVPVAVQRQTSAVNNDQVLVNTIEFRDTGVIFKVTPKISSDGMVSLNIVQEVSTVSPSSSDSLTPTISQRKIESSVVVGSGETIVLGGLFSDTANDGRSGLPVLSRAPIIGGLFGTTVKGKGRTELVVLIQPRILRNQADARALTDELRSRVTGLTLVPKPPSLSGAGAAPTGTRPDAMPTLAPRRERTTEALGAPRRTAAVLGPGEERALTLPPALPADGVTAAAPAAALSGEAMVQLGAVKDEAAAEDVWRRAFAGNPTAFAQLRPRNIAVNGADGTRIIRVQVGPMGLAEANDLCRALATPCLVVR